MRVLSKTSAAAPCVGVAGSIPAIPAPVFSYFFLIVYFYILRRVQMNSFMNHLTETLKTDSNLSITENGAIGYRTTGKKLLDMNFAVSSLCAKTEAQIIEQFTRVFYERPALSSKMAVFCPGYS
jgi:hypothetical protein